MKFEFDKPVETQEATIEVDPLPIGQYGFRLVVQNEEGQQSLPAQFIVTVEPL